MDTDEVNPATIKLSPWVLGWIWCRLFLLQASWNYETMQGLGIAYAIKPGLRRLYGDAEFAKVLQQHTEYFNTHPYMTPAVVGSGMKLEQDRVGGDSGGITARQFSEMVMAPYAAVGDALFWGGLKPLAAVISIGVALYGSLWAPIVFMVLFGLPHLWIGMAGFVYGFREGLRLVERIQKWRLSDLAVLCKKIAMVALGGVAAVLCLGSLQIVGQAALWAPLIAVVVVPGVWLTKRGLPPTALALLMVGLPGAILWILKLGFF